MVMDMAMAMVTESPSAEFPAPEQRRYEIAGICFRVLCPSRWMFRQDGLLVPFRTEREDWNHTIQLDVVHRLTEPEGECLFVQPHLRVFLQGDAQVRYDGAVKEGLEGAYIRIHRQGTLSRVQILEGAIREGITPKILLNVMEAEHHIVRSRGFLLHAACVEWKGRAILFTAPSGVGKSTQADLWCRLRQARLINGDRAAVMVGEDRVMAMGIPFSGSSGVCRNGAMPVAAIVYLGQAERTQLHRIQGVKAFRRIWEGCCVNVWDREDVALCTDTVMEAAQRSPVFFLDCRPDESAVKALEQALEV